MRAIQQHSSVALRRGVPQLGLPALRPKARATVRAHVGADLAASISSVVEHVSHASNALYALADDAGVSDAVNAAAAAAAPVAAAASTSTQGAGPFDWLADAFEKFLTVLDEGLERGGVPYSYGFAIIVLTILVKAATFPLTKKQVESTVALQALQPRVKELQARYANDPETLQLETARLYQGAGVNPLAGCLPTLATIPVFIALYRALSKAADDGLLTDGFFWIPSLGGPTSLAMRTAGSGFSWLFPFQDGHPPLGWHDTGAYLLLPVLLTVSQYATQKLMQPPNQDPSQASANAILKFLPFMIGWFSLNVPSGLTLYWFVNNILSTAQQLYLKKTTKVNIPDLPVAATPQAPIVKPKEERVKSLPTGKDLGSRKKKRDDEGEDDGEGGASGGKGQKFRALKAREVASKAANIANSGSSSDSAVQTQQELKVPDAPPSKE